MTTAPAPRPPTPLVVAASLVALEGILLVGYGVAVAASTASERPAVGATTGLFFLLYGAGLAFCAWSMTRLHSWARSPIVLAQLIQLGVAWWAKDGSTTPIAIALALVAVLVLVGISHPASLGALAEDDI